MSNTPPEIIEQWRAEFEAQFCKKWARHSAPERCAHHYFSDSWECAWQGFLLGRQSACIELTLGNHLGTDRNHDFISVEKLLEAIAAQGYQCRVKGE